MSFLESIGLVYVGISSFDAYHISVVVSGGKHRRFPLDLYVRQYSQLEMSEPNPPNSV